MTAKTKTPASNLDVIVARYISLRDKKAELKKQYDLSVEDIDLGLKRIEAHFLKYMQDQGVESLRTASGTPYIALQVSASVADRVAYMDYIKENEAWDMLDVRANKAVVQAFREEHNDLPPGLNWREERVVRFRRS